MEDDGLIAGEGRPTRIVGMVHASGFTGTVWHAAPTPVRVPWWRRWWRKLMRGG